MKNIYRSNYEEFANKTLHWLPMDTKELYKSNLSSKKYLLELNHWVDQQIEYQFNSDGFRSDEFKTHGIMFLGCSNTCGIGLPKEDMWAYQVAQTIKLPYCNLGIGGSGPDTAFRLGAGWIQKLQPRIIVYLESPAMRLEFIDSKKINLITIGNQSKLNEFYRQWAMEDYNNELNYEKNRLALSALAQQHGAQFLYLKSQDLYVCSQENDLARDLVHLGRVANNRFSQKVLNALGSIE